MCIFRKHYAGWTAKEKKTQAWDFKRSLKKRTRNKREKKPQTLCLCAPMVIIKAVDAENESVYFLKKLNVASCPPIYV